MARGAGGASPAGPHENHEMNFMMLPIQPAPVRADYGAVNRRSFNMKWETPQAIEFRFGMEITMYVANR